MASKLLLLGLLVNLLMLTDAERVGVCNGRNGNNLPLEPDVVTLYQTYSISKMRIYDPNRATLDALRSTNIELIIDVPRDDLQLLTDQNEANKWVNDHIKSYPDVNFKYIAVGNEVDPNSENSKYVDFVLPAMQSIYTAIKAAGLDDRIKVSTATYTGLLETAFPPSKGEFKTNVVGFIQPIIAFLAQNNLPMLANIYPYFGYLDDPNSNLPYALFTAQQTVVNDDNGLQYSNLFDAMLDAHYAAQARVGGENVKIVVSETGWPSEGGREATVGNAGTYYKNLIDHVRGSSTPAKPGIPIEAYLFAMFDENIKRGDEIEKHFGIFSPEQQIKYDGLSFN